MHITAHSPLLQNDLYCVEWYVKLYYTTTTAVSYLSVLTVIFQPVFIETNDDGGGGDIWTTGAISRAKLQSKHHYQQTNIHLFVC